MDPREINISVTTSSAAATVAGSAAPIRVISNEVIRPAFIPGGSILRELLTKKDAPSRGATAATSAGASRSTSVDTSKFNLLEGLGDDFFNQEPVDDDVIARIIEEIVSSATAADSVTTASVDNGETKIASVDNGETEIAPSAAAVDPRAPPPAPDAAVSLQPDLPHSRN